MPPRASTSSSAADQKQNNDDSTLPLAQGAQAGDQPQEDVAAAVAGSSSAVESGGVSVEVCLCAQKKHLPQVKSF